MKSENWSVQNIPEQTGKVAIVTGANTGIGFEGAKALAQKGAQVVLACRTESKAQDAMSKILAETPEAKLTFLPLDLSRLASVREFAPSFIEKFDRLDMLINNAGIMTPPFELTEDGFESQFGVNHLAHFALTGLLLERLESTPDSRVVTLSSQAHRGGRIDFKDLNASKRYGKVKAYTQSKLACLLFAQELQRRLVAKGSSVQSLAAHPGVTRTELIRHMNKVMAFLLSMLQGAPEGALPMLRAATDPAAKGGEYYGPGGFLRLRGAPRLEKPARRALNVKVAQRLWEESEKLTGVSYLSD